MKIEGGVFLLVRSAQKNFCALLTSAALARFCALYSIFTLNSLIFPDFCAFFTQVMRISRKPFCRLIKISQPSRMKPEKCIFMHISHKKSTVLCVEIARKRYFSIVENLSIFVDSPIKRTFSCVVCQERCRTCAVLHPHTRAEMRCAAFSHTRLYFFLCFALKDDIRRLTAFLHYPSSYKLYLSVLAALIDR